jgi:hypothetical protein
MMASIAAADAADGPQAQDQHKKNSAGYGSSPIGIGNLPKEPVIR